ncbi:MAG: polysaccharide deacetylase family protein [Neisseriaceae bacterium]|nr:polysaccharide deacetylase family protein [Neisseriaceae bacterium]
MNKFKLNLEDYVGQGIICVTYDDGLRNNFELAMPEHLDSGVPATFSVIAHRTVNPKYWDKFIKPYELACMDSLGFEISSHGYYHEKKFIDMNSSELDTELYKSKELLEGIMPSRKPIASICIPFGSANENVIKKSFKAYDIVRLSAYKNIALDRVTQEPLPAYPVLSNTAPDQVFKWIDKAVHDKNVIILMLHGIAEDIHGKGDYYYSVKSLKEILSYIALLGKEKLLPLCLRDLSILQKQQLELAALDNGSKKKVVK